MISSFGKFRLLQRIGGGRLSQVFRIGRIWGEEAAPRVVLKRVAPELIGERAFVKLVAREAGLLSRLTHPNLCACQEMGVIDGCAFLTLDLVDGCTLRALLRRLAQIEIRLATSAVLAAAAQAAEVLDYLHRRCPMPLIHLDLSPQNVMFSREGQLKLIDFGIARFLDGHDPPPLEGRIAGTVGYMSPEQARGEKRIDARADQYALGILLWEMLGGRRLFAGNTPQTWRRMRQGDVPSLRSVAPSVAQDLARLLERLLASRPADRFTDFGVVGDELTHLSSSLHSGRRPLAALINRLMNETDFDPFDVVLRSQKSDEELEQAREAVAALHHDLPPVAASLGQEEEEDDDDDGEQDETSPPVLGDIPTGEVSIENYEELSISVDHGDGTPSAQMRAIVPLGGGNGQQGKLAPDAAPESPFLEPSASFDVALPKRRRRKRKAGARR